MAEPIATVPPGQMPSRTLSLFVCPHCGRDCGHSWDTLGTEIRAHEGIVFFDPLDAELGLSRSEQGRVEQARGWVGLGTWAVSRCQGCHQVTIWFREQVVYPQVSSAPPAHPDMPAEARELYEEARAVLPASRRAAAALARATLEHLLPLIDPEAPTGATFGHRIQRVQEKVSPTLGEMLDVIRHAGNKALHAATDVPDDVLVLVLEEDDVSVIGFLFETINDLVDELVTKPRRRAQLSGQLPTGVRDGIAHRAAVARQLGAAAKTD